MNRSTSKHLTYRRIFISVFVLILTITTFSASTASGVLTPTVDPVMLAPVEAPAASAQDTLDTLTLVDTLGVQSIAPSHFASGGSTVKAAGARFVHFGIEWDDLAPTDIEPAAYDWTAYDSQMDLATSLGYEIMITLGHNPDWAASFQRGPINCVALSRFTDYVNAVVTRYGATPYNVKFWAFYNEPDAASATSTELNCKGDYEVAAFGDHPSDYVDTLEAGYDTIKAIDADAVVMLGGIAYDGFTTDPSPGPFVESFLDDILTLGAASFFDVMNFHYYPWYDWRWEGLTGEPGLIGKTHEIQAVLTSHGESKPIVCTELGESSGGQYPSDPRTEDSQAIAVVKQFARAIAAGNKIGIWYNMNDYSSIYGFGENGLLDYPSFSPKPSLSAFETLASYLPNQEFVRVLGATEWDATNLEAYMFWDLSTHSALYVLWSRDGSSQTITLPLGVNAVVDKFGDPVSYGSTLSINEQPRLIIVDLTTLFLPLITR